MTKIHNRFRKLNSKLQEIADQLNVHWFVVFCGITLIFIGIISSISYGIIWFWHKVDPEPTVYIIKSRIENLQVENSEVYQNSLNGKKDGFITNPKKNISGIQ